MPTAKCTNCGAKFSGDAVPAGGQFTCGSCGETITVRARPRIEGHARHGRDAVRNDPAKRAAKTRIAAAKMCSTAKWCAVGGVVMILISFVFFPGAALVAALVSGSLAVVCGIWGRLWLGSLGPAPDGDDISPIERVAARMSERGRRESLVGILVGLAVGAFVLTVFGSW